MFSHKIFLSVFVSLFVFILSFNSVNAADLAGSKIAVLDLEMVVQKSDAGQSVQKAIKTREDAIEAEAKKYRKDLQQKEQKLIADRKAGQDDKAFETSKKSFEESLKSSQKAIIKKNQELEKSKLGASKDIQSRIAKITADIADEQKLSIVVDRKFVVIAEQNLDITQEVLDRLNKSVKSIPLK